MWRLHLSRYPKVSGYGPGQPSSRWPCLSWGAGPDALQRSFPTSASCGFVNRSIFFFPNSNQALEYQQILTRVFISTEYPYLCFCFRGWLVGLFVILGTCSYLRALKRSLATFVSVIAADEIKPLSTSACGWIIMLALKPRALQVSFQI